MHRTHNSEVHQSTKLYDNAGGSNLLTTLLSILSNYERFPYWSSPMQACLMKSTANGSLRELANIWRLNKSSHISGGAARVLYLKLGQCCYRPHELYSGGSPSKNSSRCVLVPTKSSVLHFKINIFTSDISYALVRLLRVDFAMRNGRDNWSEVKPSWRPFLIASRTLHMS